MGEPLDAVREAEAFVVRLAFRITSNTGHSSRAEDRPCVLTPDFRGRVDRALDILKAAPPDVTLEHQAQGGADVVIILHDQYSGHATSSATSVKTSEEIGRAHV